MNILASHSYTASLENAKELSQKTSTQEQIRQNKILISEDSL